MAISMDWTNKIINIPRDDMLLIQSAPTEIRELNLDNFRLELRSIEASEEGMPFLPTHTHIAPITVGGVTLARVIEIINGYTVTFEDGQYAVNLSGANSNVGDVVNVNQVSVRSANSAGLTYSKQIEDMTYLDGRIWVDTNSGVTGTLYPVGTPALPSVSFNNAYTIASNRNLPDRYRGVGSASVSSFDLDNFDLLGAAPDISEFIIGSGCTTNNLILERVNLSSAILNGTVSFKYCDLGNITNFDGTAENCGLYDTVTLVNSVTPHEFISCHSNVSGNGNTPIIDCNNISNLELSIRGYIGGLQIINVGGSNSAISVDLVAGHVIFDSSVTTGDIVVRGAGYVTNNSSVNINISGLTADKPTAEIIRKFMTNRMETNPTTGILTVYDDDDTTVLYSGNIYEDVLASQLYQGSGLERRNRLT